VGPQTTWGVARLSVTFTSVIFHELSTMHPKYCPFASSTHIPPRQRTILRRPHSQLERNHQYIESILHCLGSRLIDHHPSAAITHRFIHDVFERTLSLFTNNSPLPRTMFITSQLRYHDALALFSFYRISNGVHNFHSLSAISFRISQCT